MWVRDQDKTALVKCNIFMILKLYYGECVIKGRVLADDDSSLDVNLATYSNLEKAKKVLDRIEKWLDSGDVWFCENGVEYSKTSKTVFQMPEDDEVK